MSKISLFASAKSTIPESVISIEEFLTAVKFGKWKPLIDLLRTEPDKREGWGR